MEAPDELIIQSKVSTLSPFTDLTNMCADRNNKMLSIGYWKRCGRPGSRLRHFSSGVSAIIIIRPARGIIEEEGGKLIITLGLFGYFFRGGSPAFVLALRGVQLPLPVLEWP